MGRILFKMRNRQKVAVALAESLALRGDVDRNDTPRARGWHLEPRDWRSAQGSKGQMVVKRPLASEQNLRFQLS